MNDTTPIGITTWRNQHIPFGIKPEDRFGHIYCIGKTGTGKSTLLLNMAAHDIANSSGVCVLDPHGELAETLLEYVPEHRRKDLIYFDAADEDWIVPFNPLIHESERERHAITSRIMSAFFTLWAESWGPRMAHVLRNAISTLLCYPQATLLDIIPLLTNPAFRNTVLVHVTEKGLRAFWQDEFDKYTPAFRSEVIAPILNKVGIFQSSPVLRRIVGSGTWSINIGECMNTGKVVLINLSKGLVGEETCAILGSLILAQLQTHALARAAIPAKDRRPFHVYVDEAHAFLTMSFASILSEARKYKLSLFLTHQYTAQLPEEIRSAVFGNVGTFISFRVGHEDAEIVAREFFPVFTEEDVITLPRFSCYLKLMIDGATSRPFSAATCPPAPKTGIDRNALRREARERYGVFRELIEKEMVARYTGREVPAVRILQERLF